MKKLKKLKKLLKEFNGVGGVAGLGVSVNGDSSQAEPGVNKKKKNTPVMSGMFRRKLPKK